jgi:polyisoprenoid-binding protein YceI
VATFPTITFFSDSIVENDGVLSACGVMTSKGVTHNKTIPFELVSLENTRLSVHATFKILRSEFTIGEVGAVSDEVLIDATLTAKKNKE